jgi:hypothetical protein
MLVAKKKSDLKVAITPALKEEFDRLCERKRISRVSAIEAFIEALTNLSDETQSVLLGQTTPTPAVLSLMLRELSKRGMIRGGPRVRGDELSPTGSGG